MSLSRFRTRDFPRMATRQGTGMHNGASDAERADASRLAGSKVLVAEATAVIALDLEHTLRGFGCGVLGPVGSVASLGVPFALATAHDCSKQDEPVLRGVPCVPKPYGSRQLYRALIDLLGPEPETLEPV